MLDAQPETSHLPYRGQLSSALWQSITVLFLNCPELIMPAKKKVEKVPASKSKKAGKDEAGTEESAADMLRKEGIVATFAQNSRKAHRNVRDINVTNLTVLFHGSPIVEEAELSLNYGNRYGLIGRNGCGKSTLMRAIGARCFPIPDGIEIFHLKEEIEASDMTAKEAVMSVDLERSNLEREAEELNDLMGEEGLEDTDEVMDRLTQVYERLEELDAATAEVRASKILAGLGFTPEKQMKKTKEFSGGWRMRISLARALFIQPTLLLLDEPTNHLDMEAVIWLEDYLSKWSKILLLVSHSQDFLNSVCTNVINFTKKKLNYYSGNYDAFVQTRAELEEEQMTRYKREQDQIKQMKEYVAKFGHGTAKNAKQAQSKEKVLDKMVRGGLTEKVEAEKALDFKFLDPGRLAPPVLQCNDISFGYPSCEILYSGVSFGIDLDSRVALVGPNGAGKSTLLKIVTGELQPLTGSVRPHAHLRFSKFTQHFIDVLDLSMTPLDYFMSLWPDMTREDCRKFLGRFGISGAVQTQVMGHLSDGQKSRVVLSKMANENPHLLLLDEPTNHLDMESCERDLDGGQSHSIQIPWRDLGLQNAVMIISNVNTLHYILLQQLRKQLQKSNLIDADSTASVKLAPALAPPLPPTTTAATAIATPSTSSSKSAAEEEEEAIRRGRMELAELAIRRQRARQQEEKGGVAVPSPSLPGTQTGLDTPLPPPVPVESSPSDSGKAPADKTTVPAVVDTSNMSEEDKKKEEQRARRRAEKEAKAAQEVREEEERKQRREEKLRDMEEAKKLKEENNRLRAEREKERMEKEARKKAEDDAQAALVTKALEEKKQERERRRAAREEARRVAEEDRRAKLDTAARADPWTQEQQLALEGALLDFPSFLTPDKLERWTKISDAVSGKNKNQCIARYRFLKQVVAANKKAANEVIPDVM
eukprot:gene2626-5152_t